MKIIVWIGAASSPPNKAFTRLELLAVAGALLLLTLVALPLAGNTRTRSDRIVCLANLRQIGRAYQLWASEHGDRNPFLVNTNEGGIFGVTLANNAWYHYAWISNELVTPRVLVCPSDTGAVRVATDFSSERTGGFVNPAYRNNAASYFVGLHAFFYYPRSILGGDRNVVPTYRNTSCGTAGLSLTQFLGGPPSYYVSWTNIIHGPSGNLLFNDGSAQESSRQDLQQALRAPDTDWSQIHIVVPR